MRYSYQGMWTGQLISEACHQCEDGSILIKKHKLRFIWVQVEADSSYYLFQALKQGFGLGWCICKNRSIINVCYIRVSFYEISSSLVF